MVYINSLKFDNLYSYSNGNNLELSQNNVIVGPNNSGKSNIFRIIQLLQKAFAGNHELKDSEIFPKTSNAFLEADIVLSDSEAIMIVKHLSFYPIPNNDVSRFFEFQNFEKLVNLLKNIVIKLTWKKSLRRQGYEPFIEILFTKTGLVLSGQYWPSYFMISNKVGKADNYPMIENVKLHEFLDEISKLDNPKENVDKLFSDTNQGKFLKVSAIKRDSNYDMPDKGREVFHSIMDFLDIDEGANSDIALFQIIGKILDNGIKTTRGGLNLNQITNAELSKRLLFKLTNYVNQDVDGQKAIFNQTLETQALKKDLEFVNDLREDGGNIAQYLFSLRNSPRLHDREKYRTIKQTFENVCASEDLEFDVILDYDVERTTTWRSADLSSEPKFPKIVITNKHTRIHYPMEKIGTGISEILYLLTTSYGLEDTVILMDEPSVNLHPPKTKELIAKIAKFDSKNQFLIITHSPELTHISIFENNADVYYVRKVNGTSRIFAMKKERKATFDEERGRLKHQIDSRVFFGKCVILCEGESDRNLFGIVDYLLSTDNKYNLASNDVLITSIGGHSNFPKYRELLSSLGIPFVILADIQAKRFLPEPFATMTKDGISDDSDVIVLNGDLEDLMNEIDGELYAKIKSEVGKSKPTVAFEFAKRISEKNPNALNSIKSLIEKAIKMSKI